MSEISSSLVKELRERTGAGMMECKKALTETKGDIEKAIDDLRKKGIAKAAKKADRKTEEGFIGSYIHSNGKIGVLVEICCETDFVGKNENFRSFAKDVAMHIAAANPLFLKREDIPVEFVEKERSIHQETIKNKPDNIVEKIVDGKMAKYYSEVCLMEQPFVKDDQQTIQGFLTSKINEIGENIVIKRFVRFHLGS